MRDGMTDTVVKFLQLCARRYIRLNLAAAADSLFVNGFPNTTMC